jgi:hypothetical protein
MEEDGSRSAPRAAANELVAKRSRTQLPPAGGEWRMLTERGRVAGFVMASPEVVTVAV